MGSLDELDRGLADPHLYVELHLGELLGPRARHCAQIRGQSMAHLVLNTRVEGRRVAEDRWGGPGMYHAERASPARRLVEREGEKPAAGPSQVHSHNDRTFGAETIGGCDRTVRRSHEDDRTLSYDNGVTGDGPENEPGHAPESPRAQHQHVRRGRRMDQCDGRDPVQAAGSDLQIRIQTPYLLAGFAQQTLCPTSLHFSARHGKRRLIQPLLDMDQVQRHAAEVGFTRGPQGRGDTLPGAVETHGHKACHAAHLPETTFWSTSYQSSPGQDDRERGQKGHYGVDRPHRRCVKGHPQPTSALRPWLRKTRRPLRSRVPRGRPPRRTRTFALADGASPASSFRSSSRIARTCAFRGGRRGSARCTGRRRRPPRSGGSGVTVRG
ncbi:hypothetical protein EES37_17025 [Streptomyces sp. ADI91-18]|nr:hypothetical protein EES37_17025 [Streptomyces sp. ADI91-18]